MAIQAKCLKCGERYPAGMDHRCAKNKKKKLKVVLPKVVSSEILHVKDIEFGVVPTKALPVDANDPVPDEQMETIARTLAITPPGVMTATEALEREKAYIAERAPRVQAAVEGVAEAFVTPLIKKLEGLCPHCGRGAKTGAERQKAYRERKKAQKDG